jgi:quercetin dioxygenase-like cupin family protein
MGEEKNRQAASPTNGEVSKRRNPVRCNSPLHFAIGWGLNVLGAGRAWSQVLRQAWPNQHILVKELSRISISVDDMNRSRGLALVAGISCLIGVLCGFALGKTAYPPLEVLLSSSQTVLGQPIAYPTGVPKLTAAIITMEPGQETGLHTHRVPLFAYVLSGELTVDYGADGIQAYRQGTAFLEAFNSGHNGRNSGATETRLLAVFIGAEGIPNTEMTP